MVKAKFEVSCPEIGFSRSVEITRASYGYVHQLADDMARAIELYETRIELHRLKQEAALHAKPSGGKGDGE